MTDLKTPKRIIVFFLANLVACGAIAYQYSTGDDSLTATASVPTAGEWSSAVNITIKNVTSQNVYFESAGHAPLPVKITFISPASLSSAWGTFPSYPQIAVKSEKQNNGYDNTVTLNFPAGSWAKKYLAPGESMVVKFNQNVYVHSSDIKNIAVSIGGDTQPPVAEGVELTCLENKNVAGAFNGSGGKVPYTYKEISKPAHGSLNFSQKTTNKEFVYTPNKSYTGKDSFFYSVIDANGKESNKAVVAVTVKAPAPPADLDAKGVNGTIYNTTEAVGVDLNNGYVTGGTPPYGYNTVPRDYKSAYGSAGFDGSRLTYTPNKDVVGVDNFQYQVTDSEKKTATAGVNVNIVAPSSDKVLVGYLPNWGVPPKVSECAQNGYNIVALAFGVLNGNAPMTFYDNVIAPISSWKQITPDLVKEWKTDIDLAKTQGLKYILISVGGSTNTLTMGEPKKMAENVCKFLEEYGFDGIDFDLEIVVDQGQLNTLIEEIKNIRPTAIVTCAPQLNGCPTKNDVTFVTTGGSRGYDAAIKAGNFDYLFIQCYNTGAKENVINGKDETMTEYIPAAYNYLTSDAYKKKFMTIPSTTKLVFGEPANTQGAPGSNTIFHHNPPYPDVYQALTDAYRQTKGEMYGGAMTWQITLDKEQGWKFAKAAKAGLNISKFNL